jgi:hypothetical protein
MKMNLKFSRSPTGKILMNGEEIPSWFLAQEICGLLAKANQLDPTLGGGMSLDDSSLFGMAFNGVPMRDSPAFREDIFSSFADDEVVVEIPDEIITRFLILKAS